MATARAQAVEAQQLVHNAALKQQAAQRLQKEKKDDLRVCVCVRARVLRLHPGSAALTVRWFHVACCSQRRVEAAWQAAGRSTARQCAFMLQLQMQMVPCRSLLLKYKAKAAELREDTPLLQVGAQADSLAACVGPQ